MRVLLTGADGFLGSNIARELLKQGYEVTALLQDGRPDISIRGLNITKVSGDILNTDSLSKAMAGCDYVIHAAAYTGVWPSRDAIHEKINFQGTQNVIQTAVAAGVKRIVYVSTANSFGFGTQANPGNETKPYASATYGLDYMDTKYKTQEWVLEQVKTKNFPVIIVNPTFMLGPYDNKPSSGAMIVALKKGQLPGYSMGGKNYVYVKDVAKAVVNAISMGRMGECYILGNQNLSYKEAFSLIADAIGAKKPKIGIPKAITKVYGLIGELISKLTGKPPVVSYPMARIACDGHYFSAEKAVKELQLPQTDLKIAIQEADQWFLENGYYK